MPTTMTPQIAQIIQGYEAQIEQILQLTHLESIAKANTASAKQYLNQISELVLNCANQELTTF